MTSGPVASIYLNDLPADQRGARAEQIIAKLKTNDFLHVWKSQDVPAEFHYSDPTAHRRRRRAVETGLPLDGARNAATMPAFGAATHGYDPAQCPNMLGFAIAWRYRHPLTSDEIGPIDNTQWHATVARILGIEPSPKSDPWPIDLH